MVVTVLSCYLIVKLRAHLVCYSIKTCCDFVLVKNVLVSSRAKSFVVRLVVTVYLKNRTCKVGVCNSSKILTPLFCIAVVCVVTASSNKLCTSELCSIQSACEMLISILICLVTISVEVNVRESLECIFFVSRRILELLLCGNVIHRISHIYCYGANCKCALNSNKLCSICGNSSMLTKGKASAFLIKIDGCDRCITIKSLCVICPVKSILIVIQF